MPDYEIDQTVKDKGADSLLDLPNVLIDRLKAEVQESLQVRKITKNPEVFKGRVSNALYRIDKIEILISDNFSRKLFLEMREDIKDRIFDV